MSDPTPGTLHFEDYPVGRRFRTASLTVGAEAIKAFAAQFDPQPFHTDERAAAESFFGGLAASGWHTAALTMGLLVRSGFNPAGGMIGSGIEALRWPRPVRPGDTLTVEAEVLEARRSRSRPTHGLVRVRATTLDQRGAPVQVATMNILVPCREPVGGA